MLTLAKAGVPYELVESTPGRASLVARLKGDGSARPLLLLAHLDTVGAEAQRWSFPPLAGDEVDGAVRGRGAVDDKSMAAVFAVVLADLARRGPKLKRDVIFAATADEESGGQWGVRWLLENRPQLLAAEPRSLSDPDGLCVRSTSNLHATSPKDDPQAAEQGQC